MPGSEYIPNSYIVKLLWSLRLREHSTRDNCRHKLTLFKAQKVVVCRIAAKNFVESTFLFRGANSFRILLCHFLRPGLIRCCVVACANLKSCKELSSGTGHVPSSRGKLSSEVFNTSQRLASKGPRNPFHYSLYFLLILQGRGLRGTQGIFVMATVSVAHTILSAATVLKRLDTKCQTRNN